MVPVGRLGVLLENRAEKRPDCGAQLSHHTRASGAGHGAALGRVHHPEFQLALGFPDFNLPIGMVGFLLVLRYIPNIRETEIHALDVRGFLLSGIGAVGAGAGAVDAGPGISCRAKSPAACILQTAGVLALGLLTPGACPAYRNMPLINLNLLKPRSTPGSRRRRSVSNRRRCDTLFVAAHAATGFWPQPVSVRAADLRIGDGRDVHEDADSPDSEALRVPRGIDGQRGSWLLFRGGIRTIVRGHPHLVVIRRSAIQRLPAFAAVHRPERHHFCGCQQADDEPGDQPVEHGATVVPEHGRGDRGVCGASGKHAARTRRHRGVGFLAGIPGHRRDLRRSLLFHLRLPADAGAEVSGHATAGK